MLFTALQYSILTISLTALLTSCGGGSNNTNDNAQNNNQNGTGTELSTTPVAGKIGGNDFIFKGGYARQTTVTVGPKPEDKSWAVWLYSEPLAHPCDMFEKHGSMLVAFSESFQTVGRTQPFISLEKNADTAQPHIDAAQGVLQVDEITDAHIVGRITVSFDYQSYAAGRFDVVKCPAM